MIDERVQQAFVGSIMGEALMQTIHPGTMGREQARAWYEKYDKMIVKKRTPKKRKRK